jgi:serine/threonine protein phosphatase PrpC
VSQTEPDQLPFGSGEAVAITRAAPHRAVGGNEDALGVFPVRADGGVLAVADGVGGQPAGANASNHLLERLWDSVLESESDRPLRSAILDAVEAANLALMERGVGSATTFVAAEIDGRRLRPYHVGDSALFVIGGRGKIKHQTVPHSPVGYAIEAGLLDEQEAMSHAMRHVISNAVGAQDMRIEIGPAVDLAPRDTVVLASDGILDNLGLSEIVERVRRGPLLEIALGMADECSRRMAAPDGETPSKPDDLALILYRPTASA